MYVNNVPYLEDRQKMKRRRNGNGHKQDLGALIDLYLLRCQVEGKSPNKVHAAGFPDGVLSGAGDTS